MQPLVAALLALVLANSSLSGFYSSFLETPGILCLGDFSTEKPLLLWINDRLMASGVAMGAGFSGQ
ncbi:hypothetical protein FKG94_18550 [Exilibacterium tricleocarpae]|uniref:Uncharacterized protein n=1 Tax=Exilibacterium tricleocarpae TaxID=2591008 RepID=A0A545T641_9GAMM|nr:Na+/H+ antiporter NhaA [Exilibacterium tricleocarpae]TQV72689.1 hypothetical protein FKG94_18550 [Exilibacterium tricleocarpae]